MKKIHGVYSIQPLTITDESISDDAKIQEHKIDFTFRPSDIAPLIDAVNRRVITLESWINKLPSFKLCPEYPNGVLTSLGESSILGLMHTDYDPIVDKTYFEWSSGEDEHQYYGIMFKHWLKGPPDIPDNVQVPVGYIRRVLINDLKFYAYMDGDVSLRVRIYDIDGNINVEKNLLPSPTPGWLTIMLDQSELDALNANERYPNYMRFEIRMGARVNGKVRIADFEADAEYTPLP